MPLPSALQVPEEHGRQSLTRDLPLRELVDVPAGQNVHDVAPVLPSFGLYDPSEHGMQSFDVVLAPPAIM